MHLAPDLADVVVKALLKMMIVAENPKRFGAEKFVKSALGEARNAVTKVKKSREKSLHDLGAIEAARNGAYQQMIVPNDAPVLVLEGKTYVQTWVEVKSATDLPNGYGLYINGELIDDTFTSESEAWNSPEAVAARDDGHDVLVDAIPADRMGEA
jgi:hypothetical protein